MCSVWKSILGRVLCAHFPNAIWAYMILHGVLATIFFALTYAYISNTGNVIELDIKVNGDTSICPVEK
jgi:hypothetical protein